MDKKSNSYNRPISTQTYGLRPYEDNCDELADLCKESGQKPGEVLRDLIDEAFRARRNPPIVGIEIMQMLEQLVEQNRQLIEQNRLANERYEQLLEKYEQLYERSARLKQGMIQNLREFYAILLETLSASIGARRLTWNYVAYTVLKQIGSTDEQIKQRYEAEKKAWIDEKDNIATVLEEAIKKMPPQP
jgi:membrane-associated HD superfamily phosphohydrolase